MSRAEPSRALTAPGWSARPSARGAHALGTLRPCVSTTNEVSALRARSAALLCSRLRWSCATNTTKRRAAADSGVLLLRCCALGCDGARMLHFELLRCKLSCAGRPAVARPRLGDHALAELLEQKFAVPQQRRSPRCVHERARERPHAFACSHAGARTSIGRMVMCVLACAYLCARVHACVHVCVVVCVLARMRVCVRVYVCGCVRACECVCTCDTAPSA
jgi:hypothetical protein